MRPRDSPLRYERDGKSSVSQALLVLRQSPVSGELDIDSCQKRF